MKKEKKLLKTTEMDAEERESSSLGEAVHPYTDAYAYRYTDVYLYVSIHIERYP